MSNNIRKTKYALIETEIDVMGGIESKIVGVYDSECESIYEMSKFMKAILLDWGNDAILDLNRDAIWIDEENKGSVGILWNINKIAAQKPILTRESPYKPFEQSEGINYRFKIKWL